MPKRQIKGKVVSIKMQKTVVVQIDNIKEHPKYKKRYKVSKKYKAHNEKFPCKTGDIVLIQECRPKSKDKKWEVKEIIKSNTREITEEPEVLGIDEVSEISQENI